MLTEVQIQTSTPMSLKLGNNEPFDPWSGVPDEQEILILEGISGLSDLKVQQYIGDFAREGSYYQGRRAERRNPVFNFKINPDYAADIEASDIREMLYRMFMEPKRNSDAVQVVLIDDRKPDRYFHGYTESIQADIFAKDLKAQCSLQTTDAYLRSVSLTEEWNDGGWITKNITYDGSADVGLIAEFRIVAHTNEFNFRNGSERMTLNWSFVPGDEIRINTIEGERTVEINGEDRLTALAPTSTWVKLTEPQNVLHSYGSSQGDGKAVLEGYQYRSAWWGI